MAIILLLCILFTFVPSAFAAKATLAQEDVGICNPLRFTSARTGAALATALASTGTSVLPDCSGNVNLLIPPGGTYVISSNLTIPANAILTIPNGGVVSINSGVTLTLSRLPVCDRPQLCIVGDGTLALDQDIQKSVVGSHITRDCLPVVPTASLTLAAFSCSANVYVDNRWYVPIQQPATAVGPLNSGDGTYWLAVHRNNAIAVSGWTRQTNTFYLWKKAATRPTKPFGGEIFAQVTVASGAISAVYDWRVPASLVKSGVYDITDELYGGIGDNSTDNSDAMDAVLAAAPSTSIVVFVPAGDFLVGRNVYSTRSGLTVRGVGWKSRLKASGGFVNTNDKGLLNIGYAEPTNPVVVTNILVQDLQIDGTSLVRPLYMNEVSDSTVSRVYLVNSGPNRGSLSLVAPANVTVQDSTITDTIGQYGDSIYIEGGSDNVRILNNYLANATRAGVYFADTSNLSPVIMGNKVYNNGGSSGGECNSGYYFNYTYDARIIGNMTERTGPETPTCDVYGFAFTNSSDRIFLDDNVVDRAVYGVYVNTATSAYVTINNLRVRQGFTSTAYKGGIKIVSVGDITINRLGCGTVVNADAYGCVVVDAPTNPIRHITVTSSTVGSAAGGQITHVAGSADFNVLNTNGLTSITLDGLQGWRMSMRDSATNIIIANSYITHDASAYHMVYPTGTLFVHDSRIEGVSTVTPYWFGPTTVATIEKYTNVIFDTVQAQLTYSGTERKNLQFTNCYFLNNSQLKFDGSYYLAVKDSYFDTFASTGAILLNLSSGVLFDMSIADSHFYSGTATDVPITSTGIIPKSVHYDNVTYNTTNFRGFTDVSSNNSTQNCVNVFGDLGTPQNGATCVCTDCTVTSGADNTCAGSGTGAWAVRINNVWRCFSAQN